MNGDYLAKAMESVVLKVLEENPAALTNALNTVLDGELECGVYLVNRLQQKMKPSIPTAAAPVASSLAEVQLNADQRVTQFVTDLKNCLVGTRVRLGEQLTDMGFATEDWAKDVAGEVVDEKMGDYCDEDAVKDLINGAWNGA